MSQYLYTNLPINHNIIWHRRTSLTFGYEFFEYDAAGNVVVDEGSNPVKIDLSEYDIFCDIKKNRKDWFKLLSANIEILDVNNLIINFGVPDLSGGIYHFDIKLKVKNSDYVFAVVSGTITANDDVTVINN